MKLSKKLKRQLKQKLITEVASVATVLTLVAAGNQAGLFARFSELVGLNETQKSMPNEVALSSETGRLSNTATTTYIYTAEDLAAFRDTVNAGDNYEGKKVYLMNDIDLSTVCSSSIGSWAPIGNYGANTSHIFKGTFDGNDHTVSNLYISTSQAYQGLFGYNEGTITKVTITGRIAATGIESGGITGRNEGTISYCHNKVNISSNQYNHGGICGYNAGVILRCSNTGEIYNSHSYGNAGGIAGNAGGTIEECFNRGYIHNSVCSAGGIVGFHSSGTVNNCYNFGTIRTASFAGGINGAAQNSYTYNSYSGGSVAASKQKAGTITGYESVNGHTSRSINCYGANPSYLTSLNAGTYSNNSWAYDVYNINNGYPVLAWQNETIEMQLNKNHEYIKVGQNIGLNVVENNEVSKKIGNNYAARNFTWTSTNEDVATVNQDGIVTGKADGTTTIYAYHEPSNMYAMAIINVARDIANPQIETGNGFTTILKSDGTVWTIGNNQNGALGNGSTQNSKLPVQVKVDEDTNLDNIVKIASGTDHVLALTADGKIYSWGLNEFGQLGHNNTKNSNYAKLVLGPEGTSYFNNIIDISAGTWGSIALDQNGNVYVWGRGENGEIGNSELANKQLPTKTPIQKAISVSMGSGNIAVLTSEAVVWGWGLGTDGQLGINATGKVSYPMKTAIDVTEISCGSYHTTIKKIDGTVYGTGAGTYGRLGTGNANGVKVYTKLTLPSTATQENKVKYIKSGCVNTTIVLTDGTVWETGSNSKGELGNGTTQNSNNFVQGLLSENRPVENVLTVGRNLGNKEGSEVDGFALNTAIILKDGDIYTVGDNRYSQIGDNTTISNSYYTRMGFVYLDYEEKIVTIEQEGYQIDKEKLKYIYSSINAYNHEQTYSVGQLEYSSEDETIAIVDENGKVMAKPDVTGVTKIKIKDTTNGYETYLVVLVNRLENTDTVTYIYTIEDLVAFRDSVNAGNDYLGKTVYVMADIDMSTACSASISSWKAIGDTTNFAGTFEGNFHTISNLYIDRVNSNENRDGLFKITSEKAVIQNLVLDNIHVVRTSNSITEAQVAAGLVGSNYGIIQNCGIKSGTVSVTKTGANTTTFAYTIAGGITAENFGTIVSSYNNAAVTGIARRNSNRNEASVGGISGRQLGTIINCYNRGAIKADGNKIYIGGVTGDTNGTGGGYLQNCYNRGTVTGVGINSSISNTQLGGIVGRNGVNTSNWKQQPIYNSYCNTNTTYSYTYRHGAGATQAGRIAPETLKTYSATLGNAYRDDTYHINEGYPILWWEAPGIELNKKQIYIKTGETAQLIIMQSEKAQTIFGREAKISDFTWNSYNLDVATVDSNGLVTGLADGYTTIYGYNAEHDIYVVCVVNVAREVANPQIETGDGFTVILKPDGTVWTLGNNSYGQLGNGTNDEKIEAEQVKIDENTCLTDVIKIAVGTNHVLALTQDGQVYSWGDNSNGQLGHHNKENSNYAKLVLGEGGSATLSRIVDISAGNYGSAAVNEFGWVFVWGNGSFGEMGNLTTNSSDTPVKSPLCTATQVSIGAGHVATITQDSETYAWGRNNYGQLGNGNTSNTSMITRIGGKGAQISCAGYETVGINVLYGDSIYVAGLNNYKQLGSGGNINKLTKVTLPTATLGSSQIKYVKAGRTTTNILLSDGRVFTLGSNLKGELGAGQAANYTGMLQGLAKDGELENIITIGRSSGDSSTRNTVVIGESGRVYTAGDDTYGQIGNHTKDNQNYFTVMGYPTITYDEMIRLHVGETKQFTAEDLAHVQKYFNIYKEDKIVNSLLDKAKILDNSIATYENAIITANRIGSTMLVVKDEETDTVLYIPVEVLPENAEVLPDSKAGENFTVGLRYNGTVWTFGTNKKGELGIGNNIDKNVPTEVKITQQSTVQNEDTGEVETITTDKKVKQISVGTSHTLVLTEDGEIYSWGANNKGQLGIGNTKNSNLPQKVEIPKNTALMPIIQDNVVKIMASNHASYAIMQDGKVYAWGETWGTKPRLLTPDYNIVDISSNYALDTDGNIYTREGRVAIVEKIKYISESDTHAVFLSENGTAYAIGSNTFGQFGDGTNVSSPNSVVAVRNEDVTDILRDIVKIEAGSGYTVALLSDDRVMEWGKNKDGQLGTDEVDETYTIRENTNIGKLTMETAQTVLFLDAGSNHVVTTLSEGNVYSWGLGENGEFGNGMNDSSPEPQKAGKDIVEANTNNLMLYPNDNFDLQASIFYFNLLKDLGGEILYESKDETVVTIDEFTGKVTAISPGTTVIVAKESGTTNIAVVQVRVLPPEVIVEPQVSTNGSHTVTLKGNGTVWCYGNNTSGELGNGTTTYSDQPVQAIFPEGTIIKQIAAGENFSVALDQDGNVWTWGANDYGQLGNANAGILKTPTKVAGLTGITKIAAGTYSVLAISENKEVYGWGLNANGELGIGSYTNKITTPTKAKNMTDVIDIAVGKNHSILLKSTGQVFVTGLNLYGQLGNDDTSIKKVNQFTKVKDLNYVARITATDSGNIVALTNGEVYSWGLNIYGELGLGDKQNRSTPTQVPNMQNIILVSGSKNHSIILDKLGKIYTTGSGKYGQQGNKSYNENLSYQEVATFENGMTISAGNTYTVVAKTDGTVWGFGDYNHGDKNYKSKTNSNIPMQVGNDDFGLGITKITVKKSETVNITSNMAYSFNLIYEDKNKTENIQYQSVNEDIAIVDEYGDVLGVKEGMTWVKAIEEDGTEHVVYVYVIDNQTNYAPMVQAGEDFASVLKADGTIWTFGHNNHGELGIGSNKTKDIPEKTNVISSYQDIKAGNSFTIAIRNDRTVWSYGKNNYGQLGIGSTKNGLNPVQVSNLTDIVQIAAGKEHSLALDSNGILYGWGRNNEGQLGENNSTVLAPVPISHTQGTISSIWAGENQSIFINTKGQVYGYGAILNGKLEGMDNAVKAVVGNGSILILTTKGEVYRYANGNLDQYLGLANIVDISMTNTTVLAQTQDERVYTFQLGQTPNLDPIENVMGIGAGVNNSYVILNNGTVYAKGNNQYGQLGNSTRNDSADFTLVGDRKFKVEPETAIMYVNDIEDVTKEMTLQEFNVFNRSITKPEEYTWTSSEETVATVDKGKITAVGEGTVQITVKDNITAAEVTIKRIVIPVEKDRIEKITVNDYEATIQGEYQYQVEVETNSNKGNLQITTKNKTDKISIDGGTTWKENGILTQEVELPTDITEIPILVQTANGTQIPYTLKIKKIATDVSLETIEVNGIKATATSSTTYEVVVAENTDVLNILARANSAKAQVSINGELASIHQATTSVQYENSIPVTMPIVVQAENGDELEYNLTIYKQSAILQLESLTVAGKEAIKTSEGVYSITVPRNIGKAEVVAKAVSELVNVSIDLENANKQISTKTVAITDEVNEVLIRLSTIVDGQEVYKDYTLNIYKKAESGKIGFVIVNGTVVTPKVDGTYEIYLPAETQNATVKVIAQNAEDFVQITTNPKEKAQSEVIVATPDEVNSYRIEVSDSETGEAESYTLYIKKPAVDNTLKQITVSNGDDIVIAKKSTEEENTYIAKVKSYDDYEIKVVTNNINALVGIENEALVKNVVTKTITRTADEMEFIIYTQAENGETAEYTLKIYVMSNDVELDFIDVNGIKAVLQSDGSYLANLETAETSVAVTAQAVSAKARVKLETGEDAEHVVTGNVTIDSKDTTTYITVEAEDGTTARYKLVIAGLPDDANLQKVVVNGKEAKHIEGQNKYEIRLDDTTFNIEAFASDSLAKVALNGGTASIGTATTTVNKARTVTTVTIKVTAQNGLESSIYTLEIKEKSDDASISNVQVNGKQASQLADGNYVATIKGSETQAVIKVEAADSFAIVSLDGETQNQNNITVTKAITQRETIYTIKVKAENGTEEEHTLTVTQLSNNTDIQELTVKWKKQTDTTGGDTEGSGQTEHTETLTIQPDGSYYLKIDRVEEVDVKAILADSNAMVKIENSNYVLAQNEKKIHTVGEITRTTITVKAEDGTIKEYPLILEKKSNDTSLKSVTSKDMFKFENNKIYVDEDLTQVDLTFVTTSDTASIRLTGETDYTPKQITRTIDLSPKPDSGEDTGMSDWVANVEVQAEDGTVGEHTIEIIKTGNVDILHVKADHEEVTNQNDSYIARVTRGTKTNVEIQTVKPNATIEIIKQTQSGEGEAATITETVIATGTGTLTKEVDLTEEPQEYIIRITSAGGSSSKDYALVLHQKSIDTGISYVKVDNLNAIQTTEEEYKITVSKKDKYPLVIKLTDEKASVKIAYKDYESEYVKGKLESTIPVLEGETLDVTITVKAENGNEQVYHLFVTRISDNVALEYVKVNGDTVTNFEITTKTYTVTVDNTFTQADLEIKAVAENSKITIGGTTENGIIQTVTPLSGPGTIKTIAVKVEAEDGSIENYTVKIIQLAASITLEKVTVNGITATKTSQTDYEVTISNKETIAEIIAKTTDGTSKVSIGGEEATLQTATKTEPITNLDDIQTTITVVAEDGITTQDYTLTIHVQDSNNSLEYVKVNSGIIEPEADKVTYRTLIDYVSEEAEIEIKLASERAKIAIDNAYTGEETSDKVVITDENSNLGVFSFKVKTPNHVTTIHYTVTSETGEAKQYTLVLTKVSTDASLKELYVKGELIEVNDDGNYYYEIENPEELLIKAVANNEYANIRIDYNPEEKQQTQANIMAENNSTKVTITITSQSGTTEKYYLYIRVLANNTELDRVVVDSQEVTDYEDKTKTYHAIVDNTKDTYEVFLMAVNQQATVELFDGESLIGSGVGSVTELVTLTSDESGHTYKVKVSLDEEHYSEYTLEVTRTSNDTSLKLVEVNDVVRQPLDTDKFIYEVGIPKLAETAKIKVQATNPYAIVQIGDNEPVRSGTTVSIDLDLSESRITVPVVVTAVDGTTTDTFNIILLRQSNNVTIESVKVNQQELDNIDDVYTYYMPVNEFKGTTEVTTVDNATIEVDGKSGIGYLEFDVDFTNETIKVEKTIKVTSEDGSTTKEYTLVIWKKTTIKGTILTENFEEKHQSTVSLYKVEQSGSTSGEQNLGTLMKQITTDEDGSFEFEIEETANYKIVVTKDGYLDYTVTDIKVTPGKTITLDTYKLLAGDIIVTGEIGLDDLVSINEQYGITVDYTEGINDTNAKYDFNEDGVVDAKDRNILKKNYGKKAKVVKWVDLEEVAKQAAKAKQKATDFVLPLNSEYTITSNYGDRFGPITETNEKHTGIDIAGEHHAQVLAVANGEVTWAGVQNGYGNCIEVKHVVNGETIYSFYAHLSEIKVQIGDKVTQGQVIALEGGDPAIDPNPGDSTGHHLHFEIRTKSGYGNDVDLSKYIKF